MVGAGQVAASLIVTVTPGPVMVCVSASIVIVVVWILVIPGRVDTTVVPSSVRVVGTPGSCVVIVDVTWLC